MQNDFDMNINSCIFCSIARGNLKSELIYEDSTYLAFMDKYPITLGHTLVVPKAHYESIHAMDDDEVGKLYSIVSAISKCIVKVVNADGFNIGQNNGRSANQIIPHVHVHIIPRFKHDTKNGKWPSRSRADDNELSNIALKIRSTFPKSLYNN